MSNFDLFKLIGNPELVAQEAPVPNEQVEMLRLVARSEDLKYAIIPSKLIKTQFMQEWIKMENDTKPLARDVCLEFNNDPEGAKLYFEPLEKAIQIVKNTKATVHFNSTRGIFHKHPPEYYELAKVHGISAQDALEMQALLLRDNILKEMEMGLFSLVSDTCQKIMRELEGKQVQNGMSWQEYAQLQQKLSVGVTNMFRNSMFSFHDFNLDLFWYNTGAMLCFALFAWTDKVYDPFNV